MTETYFLQEETKNSELEEEIRQIGENPFFNDNDNYFILKKNYNFVYKETKILILLLTYHIIKM